MIVGAYVGLWHSRWIGKRSTVCGQQRVSMGLWSRRRIVLCIALMLLDGRCGGRARRSSIFFLWRKGSSKDRRNSRRCRTLTRSVSSPTRTFFGKVALLLAHVAEQVRATFHLRRW